MQSHTVESQAQTLTNIESFKEWIQENNPELINQVQPSVELLNRLAEIEGRLIEVQNKGDLSSSQYHIRMEAVQLCNDNGINPEWGAAIYDYLRSLENNNQ